MHIIRLQRNYWLFLQTEWGISQSLDKDECKEEEPHTQKNTWIQIRPRVPTTKKEMWKDV